jgi:platelet-activating factor acetylhydrolase
MDISDPVAGNATKLILEQRSFRQAEVEETFQVLQSINDGSGQAVYNNNSRNEGQSLSSWGKRLDLKHLVMGGHSFGATLALQVLSDSLVPTNGGLTFDPGKSSGPLNSNFDQSVVIPDSEAWSAEPSEFYGQQHFEVVKSIAQSSLNKTGAGWFMTLLGTAHTSISDAPLLVGSLLGFFDSTSSNVTLGSPLANIQQYVSVSVDFFEFLVNGSRSGVLASEVTTPEFEIINLNATNAAGLFEGWEVHVAPSTK